MVLLGRYLPKLLVCLLFLFLSNISFAQQVSSSNKSISTMTNADSITKTYHYEPFGKPDGFLFVQSIPVAFFEGFSLAALGGYSFVFLPNAGAIIGGVTGLIGYPVLSWNTLRWINQTNSGDRNRFSAFYVTSEMQYVNFRTSNAPPSLNVGFALEMWSHIYGRFGLRTGFQLSKRNVSVNHKFVRSWDSEYLSEENITYTGIEYGGPVELLYLQPTSSRFDIFASAGFGIVLLTDNGKINVLNRLPVGSHRSDYEVMDDGSPFPDVQGIWLTGLGLRTQHWIWEIQYTISDSEYQTVAGVMVTDPLYTFRFRVGYRIR